MSERTPTPLEGATVAEQADQQIQGLVDQATVDMMWSLDGTGEAFTALVDLFVAEVPAQLETLASSAHTGNPEGVRRAAHTMCGTAASVGALGLARRAGLVEEAARTGTTPDQDAVTELRRYLERTVAALSEAGEKRRA